MKKPRYYMVFDVESVGLHGEGFAFGCVVMDAIGRAITEYRHGCPTKEAHGTDEDRMWVDEHVQHTVDFFNPLQVRNRFWQIWEIWKGQGAILVADCCWPVEANFLSACVKDNPENRKWEGPYPLHDIASMLLVNGVDPLSQFLRLPNELPVHNPLLDARQSARIFAERFLNQRCQHDTDGDGNCGMPACPVCHPENQPKINPCTPPEIPLNHPADKT